MVVELISVGTEILMGNILNSNTQYLAEKCALLGLDQYYQVTVGDNYGRMMESVKRALDRSDIVILTGGLGPTEDDMTKISRQLNVSMGEMFQLINVFSIVLFMLLIYLLTKLIIEKNTTSISMVKILGYENREILSLYLTATTWVVIVSIGVSLIIASALIRQIYVIMLSEYSGWLTYYIDPAIYGKMYLMGLAAYAVIAVLQFRHIQKIPMDEALKNVE